jgi:hypothetical protein
MELDLLADIFVPSTLNKGKGAGCPVISGLKWHCSSLLHAANVEMSCGAFENRGQRRTANHTVQMVDLTATSALLFVECSSGRPA